MLSQLSKTIQSCGQSVRRFFRPLTQGISVHSLLSAVLVHSVLAVLLLQWQVPRVASHMPPQARIIEVSVFTDVPALQTTRAAAALTPAQPATAQSQHPLPRQPAAANKPAAALRSQPKVSKTTTVRQQQRQSAQPQPIATATPGQPAVPVTGSTGHQPTPGVAARLNTDAILDSYISQYQARALSPAELQSVQQSKTSRQLADTPPQKRATAPGRHADVAAVLDDGSQIVRLSADRCVIADVGADLRKDIHSIRGTPCPQRNSDAAMFERIMAGIGKQP